MYICMYVCMKVYMYVCMYVFMYLCMYVCVHFTYVVQCTYIVQYLPYIIYTSYNVYTAYKDIHRILYDVHCTLSSVYEVNYTCGVFVYCAFDAWMYECTKYSICRTLYVYMYA